MRGVKTHLVLLFVYVTLGTVYMFVVVPMSSRVSADKDSVYNYFTLKTKHPLSSHFDYVHFSDPLPFWNPKFVIDLTKTSGVSLKADPPLVENGGKVTVTWSNVPDKSTDLYYDQIGLYCPSDGEAQAYLDYWLITGLPTYVKGFGSGNVTLYNMRVDCEFRYFRSNEHKSKLLAVSNKVNFVNGKEATLHGHLALTGKATQMRVHWTTATTSMPTVHYGTSADNLIHTATGISKTYKASDMCGPPANSSVYFRDPGYLHEVILTDLQPHTKYYYQYGSPGSVFSEVKTFTSALKSGDATPYTFIAYGDFDITSPPGGETIAVLVRKEVEDGAAFVMHVGDLSYALGFAYRWEHWMSLIEPYSSLAPYMICIGNHEQNHLVGGKKDPSNVTGNGFHPSWGNYGDDSGGECGVPPYYRFHMPGNGNAVWWYSFEYGLAHYTIFSTEHDFTAGSRQYAWLEKDLQSVDRMVTPWLILVGHRPMYENEKYPDDYEVAVNIREALEDVIYKYHVDMALWGHYHSYERTCAVYKEQCNPKGTVHITIGSAGAHLDTAGTWDVPWVMHFEQSFGYGRVTIANRSALLCEFVRSSDNSVADSVWLTK